MKKLPRSDCTSPVKTDNRKNPPPMVELKISTIGGIFMPRSYRHIKDYEKEILELKENGLTHREIAEKYGSTKEHIKQFFNRYNRNQRKLASGIKIKPKGRPKKGKNALPPSIQQLSKVFQLQYELARKERQVKRLKMENELMRDFLSLTERK